jgi:tRNA 2-selenouridine synthase
MIDLTALFKNDTPLIDVRAPIEFEAGHFPLSTNLPILNNEEREKVGTCYKKTGQAEAVALGHSLVSGKIKDERIKAWTDFIQKHKGAKLYCFRGGMRSQIATQWIKESGVEIELIPGGYKAIRRFLLETIEKESHIRNFYIVGGRTGSGKTNFITTSGLNFLDLEKCAQHKGSSFGKMGPQPSQITFENRIAVELLKQSQSNVTLIEAESIMIGSVSVPRALFERMRASPCIILDKPIAARVKHIIGEYVFEKTAQYQGDFSQTHHFMVSALGRIQKKLGGLNYALILKQMNDAFQSSQVATSETHETWVEGLLNHYYDPMYDRSILKNKVQIVFRGQEVECHEYLKEHSNGRPNLRWTNRA